jgi:type II secretory pathway component PulF
MEQIKNKFETLQFTRKYQQVFLEDLASLIKDGVPASKAIDTLYQISNGITKKVASHINQYISQGKLVADGMQKWMSRPIVEMIRAGETSGTLTESIEAAANSLAQNSSTLSTLLNALLYPSIVFGLALFMTVFIKTSVLDSFVQIKPVSQWPGSGQNIYNFAEFIQDWWWTILLLLGGLYYLIFTLLRHLTGDLRNNLDALPFVSLYRDSVASRFMQTLGLLITNGISLKKALSILQLDAQPYLAWHLLMMEFRLSGGMDNIADVLDTSLIKNNDLIRLKVVSKGKGFSEALISLGKQSSLRNAKLIDLTGKLLGAFILIAGAMLAASLILGIYSVSSMIAT